MSKLSAVACDVYWTGCIGLGFCPQQTGWERVRKRHDKFQSQQVQIILETDLPHPRC